MANYKTKNNSTAPKVNTITKNNINIIGDNVLYNNGIITAFYIIPLINYSTAAPSGIQNSVDDLTNMISNLTTNYPTLAFTIERIEKTIRRKDVLENLLNTIKLYRPDYTMPLEFTKNIRDDIQTYCLLGINIQQTNIANVEDFTITDTMKSLGKSLVN